MKYILIAPKKLICTFYVDFFSVKDTEKTASLSRSVSGSKKSLSLKNRKDSTAVGQATNLAAVALFFNANQNPASLDIDSEAGQCYHSEPERISNYRNSVSYSVIDSEVEALLSCQGQRKIRYFFLF